MTYTLVAFAISVAVAQDVTCLAGGESGSRSPVGLELDSVLCWNPSNGEWIPQVFTLPKAMVYATKISLHEQECVAGGGLYQPYKYVGSDEVYCFNTSTSAWDLQEGRLTKPRVEASAMTIDGQLCVGFARDMDCYNSTTKMWTSSTFSSTELKRSGSAMLNGQQCLFNGIDQNGYGRSSTPNCFNESAKSWAELPNSNNLRGGDYSKFKSAAPFSFATNPFDICMFTEFGIYCYNSTATKQEDLVWSKWKMVSASDRQGAIARAQVFPHYSDVNQLCAAGGTGYGGSNTAGTKVYCISTDGSFTFSSLGSAFQLPEPRSGYVALTLPASLISWTVQPTASPTTTAPSASPTTSPSAEPTTTSPSSSPSTSPTSSPSASPTSGEPTPSSTAEPTAAPNPGSTATPGSTANPESSNTTAVPRPDLSTNPVSTASSLLAAQSILFALVLFA